MKRFAAITTLLLTLTFGIHAQVAIGTSTVNPNAVLLLVGNGSQGLILPTSADAQSAPKVAGMVIYDTFLKKVYYCDGTGWIAIGSGGGSGSFSLQITGNSLRLLDGGSPVSTINIATATPSNNNYFIWDNANSRWTAAALSGDVQSSVSLGSTTVKAIQGVSVRNTAPLLNQVLQYDGTQWTPTTNTPSFTSQTANFALAAPVGVAGVPTFRALVAGDISSGTFTTTRGGTGLAGPFSNGQLLIGNGTGFTAGTLTGSPAIAVNNAAGSISLNLANTTVTAGSYGTAANIPQLIIDAQGRITSATNIPFTAMTNVMTSLGDIIFGGASGTPTRLAGSAGFLKSTGAAAPTWSALTATDIPNLDAGKITTGILPIARGGTGISTVPASGSLLIGNGATYAVNNLSGDIFSMASTGAVTLNNSAATRTNLGLGALATLPAVSTTEITNGTIIDLDVNAAAAIAGTKVNPDFGSQNITTLGSVGIGIPVATSKLNVYSGSFVPGTDKAVAEFYHNGGNFGNAAMVNSSGNGDGTGTVYAMGKMAGIETNPTGTNNYGFWGHQFGTGSGGWGVIASNGANPLAPGNFVALGGQSFALRIVDGNQAAGAVLKSDALGNASWGPAQSIAFSGNNGGNQTFGASTWTVVSVPTEEYDLSGNFSANTFTVPSGGAGLYHFTANVNFNSPLVNGRYQIAIWVNGINRKAVDYNTVGTNFQSMHIDCDLLLAVGDDVNAEIWISGGDTSIGAATYVYFQGRKVN